MFFEDKKYLCVERADYLQMVIDELFPKCKSISKDYAFMEKAKDMYLFPTSSPKNNASKSFRKNKRYELTRITNNRI